MPRLAGDVISTIACRDSRIRVRNEAIPEMLLKVPVVHILQVVPPEAPEREREREGEREGGREGGRKGESVKLDAQR
jgi:hypothetical protein